MRIRPRIIPPFGELEETHADLFDAFEAYLREYMKFLRSWAIRHPDRAYRSSTVWTHATPTSSNGETRRVPVAPFLYPEDLGADLTGLLEGAILALKRCRDFKQFDNRMVGLELRGATRVTASGVTGDLTRRYIKRRGEFTYSRPILRRLLCDAIGNFRTRKFEVVTMHLLSTTFTSSLKNQISLNSNTMLCRLTSKERVELMNSEPYLTENRSHFIDYGEFFLLQRRDVRRVIGPNVADSPIVPPHSRARSGRNLDDCARSQFVEGANALFQGGFQIVYQSIRCHDWLNPRLGGPVHKTVPAGSPRLYLPARSIRKVFGISRSMPFRENDRKSVESLAFTRLGRLHEKKSDQDALLDLYITVELLFKCKKGSLIAKTLPMNDFVAKKQHAVILSRLGRSNDLTLKKAEELVIRANKLRNDIVHGNRHKIADFLQQVSDVRRQLEPLIYRALYTALS